MIIHHLVAALLAAVLSAGAPVPADPVFPRGLPHAPSEDSCFAHRCVWDARHQGNGEGQSLLITAFGDTFLMAPISHRRAHRLQVAYCERANVTCRGYAD